MDDMNHTVVETEKTEIVDVESAVAEAEGELPGDVAGKVHISEDVITELARQALQKVTGIQPASSGIASKLGLGRKVTEGVKVYVDEGENPSISVDAFLMVKYGLRIPDLAWDVQETVKNELEGMTGYAVNYVNIYVQGVYFDEPKVDESSGEVVEPAESTEEEPRDDNEAIDERSETQSKDQE
ncbi:Asp23/Gls24 family envelope stress response protein [Dethiosulfovibrio sp. F2B]|uniref:Asp23/Gls24 family envelope stress response protein n=1 Tax=Dethiosulfovibrio faecalis TaxID=2720018 RepID=UPI001F2E5B9D|nr:Asp23/Gls24 family envelope stress response protein [Dethiosulfovibrio faecalis]MCF4150395.1 Asp23/Gls24 family envelope stress response protein [Dethiosulfovibrio faecalis]